MRKSKSKAKVIPLRRKKFQTFSISKTKYRVRRYEQCHDKFLNYCQIEQYLGKIQKNYPEKVQIQVLGQSAEKRSIFLVIITQGARTESKMGTMIEAGSNGCEWMTVSTALYMIDFLVKDESLVKIMDYFIIPCSNPDAYESDLTNSGRPLSMDLSNNCPVSVGFLRNEGDYNTRFFEGDKNMEGKLQGDGTKITYPFGFTASDIYDVNDLRKIAKAGLAGIKNRRFGIGSIYDCSGLKFGSMVDYLRSHQTAIKFTYIIHVNKKERRLDPHKILCYGEDIKKLCSLYD
ncbi:hypothetical protein NQ314_015787 [Rhamnusium bicolor]|uniref:Peptidase M14 domain-containing protein n=1 Tax=Rhamnusium bicolor TaxID=1586634 RepID=A0AAV8X0D3_9CUCU|nr:hypothetical protein NQ314_015787 [Rhamnusium bicolor]